MTTNCSSCGATLDASQLVCTKCKQASHRRLQFTYLNLVIPFAVGIILIFVARDTGAGWFLLNLALLHAFGFITTIIHEGGHALVAALLQMRVRHIVIGAGSSLWEFRVAGVQITFKAFALGGGYTTFTYATTDRIKVRYWLVIAAGPVANLVVVGLLVWIIGPAIQSTFPAKSGLYPGVVFVAANLIVFLANLIPFNHSTDIGRMGSDGLQLLRIPFIKQSDISAGIAAHFQMDSTQYLKDRDYNAARDAALRGVDAHREPDLVRAILLNQVAWCDLLTGDQVLLEEAKRYAIDALQLAPEHAAIKGTLGSVLIERGDHDRGIALLLESNSQVVEESHKAQNLAYMAIGYHRRGELEKAEELLRQAESLDKNDFLCERARRALR